MAQGIPEDVIEKIRQGTDIVSLISEYVSLRQNGSRFVGLCPFHNEKTPSFSVSRDKQLYYCFGCHASGNAFSFVMNMDGLNFVDAARRLGNRIGIDVSGYLESDRDREKRLFRENLIEACEAAAKYYSWMFKESRAGAQCRGYVKARGIAEDTAEAFRLGYAPDAVSADLASAYLTKKGFNEKVLLEAGLSMKKKYSPGLYDVFRDRLLFPITDQYGRVVAFGGRVISKEDKRPKYINSKEGIAYSKRTNLYNFHAAYQHAKTSGRTILCEGYIDVIAYWEAGLKEAVASLGTSLTKEQAKLILRHSKQVLISYDADAAGSVATAKGVSLLESAGLDVRVVVLPQGEDPDSVLRKHGHEKLRQAVTESVSFLRYQVEKAIAGLDLRNSDAKLAAVKKLVGIIGTCPDAVTRAELVREMSGRLAVSPEALSQDVSKMSGRTMRGVNRAEEDMAERAQSGIEESGLSYAITETERAILRLCVHNPKLIKFVSQTLTEGFEAEGSEEIYKAMYSLWEDGKAIDEKLLPLLGEKHKGVAARLLLEEESTFDDVGKAIDSLQSIRMRRRLRDIDSCIRKAEAEGKHEEIMALQVEQRQLRVKLGSRTALY